jgi:hypothetical protein
MHLMAKLTVFLRGLKEEYLYFFSYQVLFGRNRMRQPVEYLAIVNFTYAFFYKACVYIATVTGSISVRRIL